MQPRPVALLLALALFVAAGVAQVELKKDAVVFSGNASNTSAPATMDEA